MLLEILLFFAALAGAAAAGYWWLFKKPVVIDGMEMSPSQATDYYFHGVQGWPRVGTHLRAAQAPAEPPVVIDVTPYSVKTPPSRTARR